MGIHSVEKQLMAFNLLPAVLMAVGARQGSDPTDHDVTVSARCSN